MTSHHRFVNHIESTNERTNDWSEVFKHNNNSNSIRYEREHVFKMELNERKPVVYFTLHMGLEKQKYIHKRNEPNRAPENGSVSE